MIYGMTGFAERSFSRDSLRLKISIKTLNHKFFDWLYKGVPIGDEENKLREICQKKIRRGRVEVTLDLSSFSPENWHFEFNQGLLEKILTTIDALSRKTGQPFHMTLEGLLRFPQVFEIKRKSLTAEEKAFLERCFILTLEQLLQMRKKEGLDIARQLKAHLKKIRKSLLVVDRLARKQPSLFRQKLQMRFNNSHGNQKSGQENRFSEELAMIIQRYDLTEELTRLRMHLKNFAKMLSPQLKEARGKSLDFITQELIREANTINSKSQDARIIQECLNIKNEIESIREQVQNLE